MFSLVVSSKFKYRKVSFVLPRVRFGPASKHVMRDTGRTYPASMDVEFARPSPQSGRDVSELDEDGMTSLMEAAACGHVERMQTLIDCGADVNARNADGETALMIAVLRGHMHCVHPLIASGADVNARDDDGQTALMLAALYGDEKFVPLLIESGADVNHSNKDGWTALMGLAWHGSVENMRAVIRAGADVNAKLANGTTALLLAKAPGNNEHVKVLLDCGADTMGMDDTSGWLIRAHHDPVHLDDDDSSVMDIRGRRDSISNRGLVFHPHVYETSSSLCVRKRRC